MCEETNAVHIEEDNISRQKYSTIHNLNESPINTSVDCFTDTEKLILKFLYRKDEQTKLSNMAEWNFPGK